MKVTSSSRARRITHTTLTATHVGMYTTLTDTHVGMYTTLTATHVGMYTTLTATHVGMYSTLTATHVGMYNFNGHTQGLRLIVGIRPEITPDVCM